MGVATEARLAPETAAVTGAGIATSSGCDICAATAGPRKLGTDIMRQTANMVLAKAETRRPVTSRRRLANNRSCTVHHFGLGTATASAAAVNVAPISPCNQR